MPSRLGRYPVRRRIGSGAFATVWLAHDEQLDSPVAIKVLADNWAGDLHIRQRFVEEGRFLRKVESPHVVSVYDAGELEDGRPYLVMAYADRGNLAEQLEQSRLDRDQSLHVISQVGRGLTALHDRGVLHRDIKPANILFRTVDEGRGSRVVAMVGDLGLGKAMDMSSRLTMAAGTPTYVAPEQARGERLDARADQFSLAALAYVLLTGRQPYDHRSLADAAEDSALSLPMGLGSDAAEAVVLRALARDREGRFDEISDFTEALTAALGVGDPDPGQWTPTDPDATSGVRPPTGTAEDRDGDRAGDRDGEPADEAANSGTSRGRRHLVRWLAAGAGCLVLAAGAGWALENAITTERTLETANGDLSVTVPEGWTTEVSPEPWTPGGGDVSYPALAAGTAAGWNTDVSPAPGVFVGILEGTQLPSEVPGHPACTSAGPPIPKPWDGKESVTVFFDGCPGADVTVERVVRVTDNQLLWIQVRSKDGSTANRVLESVEIRGPWQ